MIYKFPHELLSDLRLRYQKTRKHLENIKTSQNYCLAPSPPRNQNPASTSTKSPRKQKLNLSYSALFHLQLFDKVLEIRATIYKKSLKFFFLGNYFPIFSLRSKFIIESLPSLVQDVSKKDKVNYSQNMTVFNN